MKRLIILGALSVALASTAVYAQTNKTTQGKRMTRTEAKASIPQRANMRADYLAKELNLTAAQRQQVYNIYVEEFANSGKRTTPAAFNEKLSVVLTPQQRSQYQTLMEQRKKAAFEKVSERAETKPTERRRVQQ